jgi:hypothetical protein
VIGNHDWESRRLIPSILRRFSKKLDISWGPEGTKHYQYHFTYGDVLFVCVNNYWSGQSKPGSEIANRNGKAGNKIIERDADIVPQNLEYLRKVLSGSNATWKLAAGHEPAWPFYRHTEDSLANHPENRDRFWKMLDETDCQIYFCGHTHRYSTYQWLGNDDPARWEGYTSTLIPKPVGVWQIDAGCVRGTIADNAFDRVIVYCKVTHRKIEVSTYISKRLGEGRFSSWEIPDNVVSSRRRSLFRWDILSDPDKNLPN